MSVNTIRIASCLAFLFAVQTKAFGNDSDIPDVQQGVTRNAQFAGPVPAAPMNGPYWAPGGDIYSGMRTGSPYYWSNSWYAPMNYGYGNAGYSAGYGGSGVAPGGWNTFGSGYGYGSTYGGGGGYGRGYPYGGTGYAGMDPYTYHYGPGFYRNGFDQGSYRFPYYNYRAPWYAPGPASYNRDTNMPW